MCGRLLIYVSVVDIMSSVHSAKINWSLKMSSQLLYSHTEQMVKIRTFLHQVKELRYQIW